jgi:hypothetical protein
VATYITFSGIANPLAAEFILSRGVTPSVCTLVMPAQPTLNLPPGTLTILDGSNQVSFTGCAVHQANFRQKWDGSRWRWAVQILDRRRTWKTAAVSGEYNIRLSNGLIIESTKKSAKELMDLCLSACGEVGYDTSQAPQNVYPYVRWDNARADLALAQLCEYTACEVCPSNDDKFNVYPLGVGGDLQDLQTERHYPVRYTPRSTPSILRVVGGPVNYQTKMLLKAIGHDTDSDQQYLEDLSYRPTNGWTYENPLHFPSLGTTAQPKALDTVYRRYRVYEQATGGLSVPGSQTAITSVSQYFPLFHYLVQSFKDPEGVDLVGLPFVEGTYWPFDESCDNVDENQLYTGRFLLGTDRGEVHFDVPVFGLSSGTFLEPTMYLTTSHHVKDANGNKDRLSREEAIPGSGGLEVLNRPEIIYCVSHTYSGTSISSTFTTKSEAEAEADAYLALFKRKYQDQQEGECTYVGLLPRGLDGKIAQVVWKASVNGLASTQVCLNKELSIWGKPRRDRRDRERLEGLL